jgi:dienelactone hydrolase
MSKVAKIIMLSAALASGVALAQTPAGSGGQTSRFEWYPGYVDPGQPQPPYEKPDARQGTGTYKSIMTTEPGAEGFTAYYPEEAYMLLTDLAAKGKLPVVIWANGDCAAPGNSYRHFLTEIASHGYLVLAAGAMATQDAAKVESTTMEANPIPENPEEPRVDNIPANGATAADLSKVIDWIVAENTRPGSRWYRQLDTADIAVMGHGCGGGLAATFGSDKRIKTIGLWSPSAAFRDSITDGTLGVMSKKPVLLVTGDPRFDTGYYWGVKGYEAMKKAPAAFYAWRTNLTYLGTYWQADGGELAPIATAWLDWKLKGDKAAAKIFKGEDCTLCKNSHWHIQKKHID